MVISILGYYNKGEGDKMNAKTDSDFFSHFFYLFHFIIRSFFLSILCFMVLLLILFFIYFGDLFLNTIRGEEKSPLFSTYIIVSESMMPTINVKDGIFIKRMDHDQYNVGDIITFSSSDSHYMGLTVTHRIMEKESFDFEESIYTTKGDSNSVVDPASVKTDSIYGRVLFKMPKIGYVSDFFSKPTNYFLCLLSVAVVIIVYEIMRIFVMLMRQKHTGDL